MNALAFVDTETTGLDVRRHDAWEIAVILRGPADQDTELLFQVRTSLHNADPKALEIGGHAERFWVPDGSFAVSLPTKNTAVVTPLTERELMTQLMDTLDTAVLVGSNPAFDDRFLSKLFHGAGVEPGWHYRTVDVATLAAGHLYGQAHALTKQHCDASYYGRVDEMLKDGWKSRELSRLMGVEPPRPGVAHTALGDARWARDVYDAVTQADAFYTASDEQLAEMAGQALRTMHGGETA